MANKPPPVICVRCGGPYSSHGHTCEAAQERAPSPLDAATCSAFTGYIPEVWSVKKDAIYAAIHAIESGLEYARQCLCDHDAALGRTTHKNRTWAETIEGEIRQMENARDLLLVRQRPSSLFDSPEWKACGDAMRKSDEERIERMTNHPDNGKQGWWIVDGIRHHAYAKASSAMEAIEKADKAGIVQDWEFPEARFWAEQLPDVF